MSALFHSITWDHTRCDHNEPDDPHCSPHLTAFTCTADAEAECHTGCDVCETWDECDWSGEMCAEEEHPINHRHCSYGHPFVTSKGCNTEAWLTAECFLDEYDGPYITGHPGDTHHDGPIEAEWVGEGYRWRYPRASA